MFEKFKEDTDSHIGWSPIRDGFIKQSYLNAIDVMIEKNIKTGKRLSSSNPYENIGVHEYLSGLQDNNIYLQEQRKLIENYETR